MPIKNYRKPVIQNLGNFGFPIHTNWRKNRKISVTICFSLLNRHDQESFWKQIITGNEKWLLYENPIRRCQLLMVRDVPSPTAKLGLHPKKVLLCIWWDYKGIIHHEVFEYGDTISADKYYQQLDRLNTALLQKRPSLVNRHWVIIQNNNAKPQMQK